MHRLLILEPEHSGGRWEGKEGDRNGEEVEHSRGVSSMGVERETKREEKQRKEGRQGIREQSKRDGKRQTNQAASLSPALITVRRVRLFITRPRQTLRLLFRKN